MMNNLLKFLNPRLEPDDVKKKLQSLPLIPDITYDSKAQRLAMLRTLYQIYIPLPSVVETYNKLYDALERALEKKMMANINKQYCENYNGITGKEFSGIMGGLDSISIIGVSGTGKTATVSRVASLLVKDEIIEFNKPYKTTIIPCLIVNCPFDCSVKTLCVEIMRLVDSRIGTNYYAGTVKTTTTTGMLIASVSNILLNHVGLLVIDEVQNVIKTKNGFNLIGALTQLVNSCGVSVCMISNPEVKPFFEQDLKLARRSIGLEFKPMEYGETFCDFVNTVFKYQFTAHQVKLSEELFRCIYELSGGIPSLIVSLIHDAQEKAIIDEIEVLNIKVFRAIFSERYGIIHQSIETPVKTPSKRSSEHLMITSNTSLEVSNTFSLENLVKYAKKNNLDVIQYLKTKVEVLEL